MMAAGTLPAPGTELGPCDTNPKCAHIDCQSTRDKALCPCAICGDSIGYDRRFYQTKAGLEHAVCAEQQIEDELKARTT